MRMTKQIRFLILFIILGLAGWTWMTNPIRLGLDLQGGSRLILEAKDTEDHKVTEDNVLGVLAVIRNRIDKLGVSEPIIRTKGRNQIVVELPGIKDPDRAIRLIGETALLEFIEAEWAPERVNELSKEEFITLFGTEATVEKFEIKDDNGTITSKRTIILKTTALTGKDLKFAGPNSSQYGDPIVDIEFNAEGAKGFQNVTSRSVGKPLAIVLDGNIISAPNVNEPISGGRAQISGGFSLIEMKDLVIKLNAGALPVPVEIISNKTVGPTLGKNSIEKSKKAGIIGFSLVCVFMLIMYKVPGIVACAALIIYLFLSLTCLKLFQATLTLPGIAGLILTIGMAVDANVIIFERIKEEKRTGQSLASAINQGFSQAFVTILDANITTLMAAGVLFGLGTGSIKGFAFTLSIGILVSMLTAIFVTRLFLESIIKFSLPRKGNLFKA
ncbi:protein translocase subunit SecD [bacterium]|nr:protein translocase subunit SecD [bacterium]